MSLPCSCALPFVGQQSVYAINLNSLLLLKILLVRSSHRYSVYSVRLKNPKSESRPANSHAFLAQTRRIAASGDEIGLTPADPKYRCHAFRPISHAWQTNLDSVLLLKPIKCKYNSSSTKNNPENEHCYLHLNRFHTNRQRLKVDKTSSVPFGMQCSEVIGTSLENLRKRSEHLRKCGDGTLMPLT